MKCTACGTASPAGTAICPKCDAILDASAFSTSPPEDEISVGPAKPRASSGGVKKVKKATTGSSPATKKPELSGARKLMPPAPPRLLKPDPKDIKPDIDWRKMSLDASNAPRKDDSFKSDVAASPEELMKETQSFLKKLNFSDKIAFAGGVATVISCFFPWKETFDQGDSLGLISLGAPVFVAAVALVAAIVVRVAGMAPKVKPLTMWIAQFGSAVFSIIWCLIFIKVAWDPTRTRSPVGNTEMWASSPSIGVVLAVVFSIVALGGTLLGLRDKPTV